LQECLLNDLSAQVIAQNLKNLTRLNIGKIFNDSAYTKIGVEGAIAVAKGLHQLTHLKISNMHR
jgi:F420-0:gamma-glutamyl ligase